MLICGLCVLFGFGSVKRAWAAERTEVLFLEPTPATGIRPGGVIDVARDQLAELGVELRLSPRPPDARLSATTAYAQAAARASSAIAVVWLDRRERATTIYFYEPRTPRLLTRRVAVSRSEAAAAEEVALILRSAISAVLEGDEVAMTEIEVPAAEPKRFTAPSQEKVTPELAPDAPPTSAGFALGLAYGGTRLSQNSDWLNGARLFADFGSADSRWIFGIAYTFFPALTLESEPASTRISRHPSELLVAFAIGPGRLQVLPEVRLIADYLWRTTERVHPELEKTAASGRFLWAVSPSVRLRYALGLKVRFFSSVGADFLLNRFDQVALEGTELVTVFSPSRVRARVEAGFSVDIF